MGNYGYEVKQYGCHVKQCCQITFIRNNLNLILFTKKYEITKKYGLKYVEEYLYLILENTSKI